MKRPFLPQALACVLLFTLTACAAKPARSYADELAASAPRAAYVAPDDAFSAVVHSAMDLGYSPTLADRTKGRFAGWVLGRYDPDKPGQAAAYNAGAIAAGTAAMLGMMALSLLTGGSGNVSPPNITLADGDVAVYLLVDVRQRDVRTAEVRVVTPCPQSTHIEPNMTDAFWQALAKRTSLQPAPTAATTTPAKPGSTH